jgi:type IV pilus assembly protein PilE
VVSGSTLRVSVVSREWFPHFPLTTHHSPLTIIIKEQTMNLYRNKGFNLIELMIVVAIIGVLAAIALPSYRGHVVKGARAAAQTELLQLASLQEKVYLNSSAYTANLATAYTGTSAGGLGKTGSKTTDEKYTISLDAPGQTYTITATPVAGSAQAGDGCLTIRENGLRQWHTNNDACASASPAAW